MTNTQYYHRLLAYVAPNWKMLTLAILGMLLLAISLLILPAFMIQVVDNIFINNDQTANQTILLTVIALFMVRGVISYISSYAINTAANNLSQQLRLSMFNKLLTLPIQPQIVLTENNLATHFIADLNQLRYASIHITTILSKDFLTIAGLLVWMFHLNWELSSLILLMIILITIATQLINGHLNNINKKIFKVTENITQGLYSTVKNHKIIKLDGAQSHEGDRFISSIKQINQLNKKQATTKTLSIILAQLIGIIVLMAIVTLTSQQIQDHQITPGEISAFVLATCMLILPLKQVLLINEYWQQGGQALKNIFSLLDKEDELDTGTIKIEHIRGEITFDKVSFYDHTQDKPILNNVSFTIKPGETVVLAGVTGKCKTALIDLILRHKNPTSGCLLIDDHNLTELNLTTWYADIALISPEKTILHHDTVAANIAYGAMQCANEAKITAAAQASYAMEFIREMPKGLQTILGKQETKLSKLQCQHIAIARAMLKNPGIVILDQIITDSDVESEHLDDALKSLMHGRTTIIITPQQNLSLRQANRMIVFKNGAILEI